VMVLITVRLKFETRYLSDSVFALRMRNQLCREELLLCFVEEMAHMKLISIPVAISQYLYTFNHGMHI
jgi:hypothetical protein